MSTKKLRLYFATAEMDAKTFEMLIFAPNKETAKLEAFANSSGGGTSDKVKVKRVKIASSFLKKLYFQPTVFQAVERG